jgi:TPR repeat protein
MDPVYAAEEQLRAAAEAGNPEAMDRLATQLAALGQDEAAEEWWRRAAGSGHTGAMHRLANHLDRTGRPDEADEWIGRSAGTTSIAAALGLAPQPSTPDTPPSTQDAGRPGPVGPGAAEAVELAAALERDGNSGGAEQLLRWAAEAGNTLAMYELGELLSRLAGEDGEAEEAVRWWSRAAQLGEARSAAALGVRRWEADDRAGAERWWRVAARAGARTP